MLVILFDYSFFFLVCSLCIRRSLNVSQKCPVCERETGMTNLRSVWILDDLVKRFQKCRSWFLEESIKKMQKSNDTKATLNDIGFDIGKIESCPYCKWDFDSDSIKIHMTQCKSSKDEMADVKRPQNLAKPIYHMLKDNQIKKKLSELDLPTDGDRNRMIWRHSEYVNMWNAKMVDSRIIEKESNLKMELIKLEKNTFSKRDSSTDVINNIDEYSN